MGGGVLETRPPMPLILWLFVSAAAAPLPPEAASWLGDAVVLEQRVVELPHDQRLLYLLKASGGFEDAFFVVDAKNAVTGWPTLRDGSASDLGVSTYAGGCPLPGHVEALTVTAALNVELRGESSSCIVRTGPEGLEVFPNLNVSFAQNYPDAKAGVEERLNSAAYSFYPLPRSSAVLASASEKCDLAIFDRETGIIDEAASASASEVICQSALISCLQYRQAPLGVGFGLQGDTLTSPACSDGGSAGCYAYCVFDSLQASCVEEGCHHSPAMIEVLEAAKTEDDRQREKHEHEVRAAGEQALEERVREVAAVESNGTHGEHGVAAQDAGARGLHLRHAVGNGAADGLTGGHGGAAAERRKARERGDTKRRADAPECEGQEGREPTSD